MILGLTGSLGSGKSTVSSMMVELGVPVVCADAIAREATQPGAPAYREIVSHFGPEMLSPDGSLDRRLLAARVFANPQDLRRLEEIVHPRVRARELELLAQLRNEPLILLDVPLLYESGAESLCDRVAVVTVDEPTRFERLRRDRGMTDEEIRRRLSAQLSQEEKAKRADHLIDNSGSLQRTRAQVETLHRLLTTETRG
ncbi:MAG: dephospho-CoA kinase [Candidatus Sumerlaeia bacterium]|nr:dephospho-CoA kinase [Candidatus Sumerlaeia bacterium]